MRLLSAIPDLVRANPRLGAAALLDLWERRKMAHPYIFIWHGFRKLKYPLVFRYDILHVTSVLARFPYLAGDPRLEQMRENNSLQG